MGEPTLYGHEVRAAIAKMYDEGVPVLDISAKTGASARTITDIAREFSCPLRDPRTGPNTRAAQHRDRLERALERYQNTDDKIEAICDDERITREWLMAELRRRDLPRRNAMICCCEAARLRRTFRINDIAVIMGASHQGVGRAIERHKHLLHLGVPPDRHEEMRRMTDTQIVERMSAEKAAE